MNEIDRPRELRQWLSDLLETPDLDLQPASGDASFRRYFRVRGHRGSLIVMDAPPAQEDCGPFLDITGRFAALGLNVPEIIAADRERGFVLMSDLGSRHYLDALDETSAGRLYGDALDALVTLQACGPRRSELPPYDSALLDAEMELFRDWLLDTHLQLGLDDDTHQRLDSVFGLLREAALAQPAVCVHRDYHSRNLMVTDIRNPGILDYQDAVIGPVTYDLVSLLRDCYICWPRDRVEAWALQFRDSLVNKNVIDRISNAEFLRWFDWMGVQRHLKASGIFARLCHRDNKRAYLADIPRTLEYVVAVCRRYTELDFLAELVTTRVLPALPASAGPGATA